jgi:hypothetical protein
MNVTISGFPIHKAGGTLWKILTMEPAKRRYVAWFAVYDEHGGIKWLFN